MYWKDPLRKQEGCAERRLATINNNTSKDSWKFKNYGAGAQILVDLGLKNILLLTNNPKKPVALDSYGLKITGHQKLDV